jgi:hypothetical protein
MSSRVSITVDTDTTQGKVHVSYKNFKDELPYYHFFWEDIGNITDVNTDADLPYYRHMWAEDETQNTFTPDTISLLLLSANLAGADDSTIVKLFRVTQEVKASSLVTAIGSTKYQAFGYDGPHDASTVMEGMNEIRDANMSATIFADVGYLRNPPYVEYLKGLIADGWELGIHYSEGLSTIRWENATDLMVSEYTSISEMFETQPLFWCSLGNLDNATYALWAKNNLNMLYRSLRVIPQNVPGSSDITNLSIDYWMGAAKSGVSTVPIYVHQTEIEPQESRSSVDASLFDSWLSNIIANDIRLTGYNEWYMINSNQLDATFSYGAAGDNTTIAVNTNGHYANVLVKIKADDVIAVEHEKQIVDYSTSPEGYIIFEVEDRGIYTISTIEIPDDVIKDNTLPLYSIGLVILVILIFLVYKSYK